MTEHGYLVRQAFLRKVDVEIKTNERWLKRLKVENERLKETQSEMIEDLAKADRMRDSEE